MKKKVIVHFTFLIAYFALITVFKRWFSQSVIPFWLGGFLGMLLPYADFLIYAYVSKPKDSVSQEAMGLIKQNNVVRSMEVLSDNREAKHEDLIFHTIYFQLIFWVFAFWIVSSAGSTFASGLVLAFALHLVIDEFVDWMEKKTIDHWFVKLRINLDDRQKLFYLFANLAGLLILGLLF